MKKLSILLAAALLATAAVATAGIVSYEIPAATNGTVFVSPCSWTPKTATAWSCSATVTVARVHGSHTNTLGTVAPGASAATLSWGSVLRGDKLIATGADGTVELQGENRM